MYTFGTLTNIDVLPKVKVVEIAEPYLREMLKPAIAMIAFDEDFYLARYADVKEAVANGVFKAGLQHYLATGYFENRLPRPITVDEKWYLAEYPDVSRAIRSGSVASALRHFEDYGFREGRLPSKGWSLVLKVTPS